MKVRFRTTWFAPTDPWHPDKVRSISGKRYRRDQVYDIPETFRELLPKDAVILSDDYVEKKPEKPQEMTLAEADVSVEKAAADQEVEIVEEVDATLQRRRDAAAKARAAKAAKRASK